MAKDAQKIENELYFCRYLTRKDLMPTSGVSGCFMLVFILSGTASFRLNGKDIETDNHKFLLLHPHVECRLLEASEDIRLCCIGSRMELQSSVLYHIPSAFLTLILQQPVWNMDEETARAAKAFCTLFDYNYNQVKGISSANIAASLLSVFIQTFYEKTKQLIPSDDNAAVSAITRNIVTRFTGELRQHYKESHQVLYYAERVCVSAKYLTQVIKKELGLTPKEIIDRKLVVESMFLLSKSDMSIQEISNELGFPDQSYFGRFFKRMLGLSPMAFRNNPDLTLMSRLKRIEWTPDYTQPSPLDD